jgi:type 2A phosphatase activator TIP41
MTPLTDPTFIAKILGELPSHLAQQDGAGTKWRGMGTKVEVAELRVL